MTAEDDLLDDFGAFYREQLAIVLAFCFGRTGDRELSADLAAEVFAAALIGRERFDPRRGSARRWLLGIAAKKVIDAQRRGSVERRAQKQLGMAVITWTEDDLYRASAAGSEAGALLGELPVEQRDAVHARVIQEREYPEIADAAGVSEATVRQRVSRGLAAIRRRLQQEASDERL